MKKLLVISLALTATLALGGSKKNPQTTPAGSGTQTEMQSGGGSTGGATYGGAAYGATGGAMGGATYGEHSH